jgi:hypothetical protein
MTQLCLTFDFMQYSDPERKRAGKGAKGSKTPSSQDKQATIDERRCYIHTINHRIMP